MVYRQSCGIHGRQVSNPCSLMRCSIPLLCLLLPAVSVSPVSGHQDPRGEIHPWVVPDAHGNFRIFYTQSERGFSSPMKMLLAEDGHERIPRHRSSAAALKAYGILKPAWKENPVFSFWDPAPVHSETILEFIGGGKYRLMLREADPVSGQFPPGPVQGCALPFSPVESDIGAESNVTEEYAAVVQGYYRNEESDPMGIQFRCCRRKGTGAGVQVNLDHAVSIYDFVTASRPVWAGGRFWIAWVRQLGTEGNHAWTTVLTGLDPVTGIAESHDLPGISHWNTSVSLAVNAGQTLCAAWAPSMDGSYPGRARIVTAVFPTRRAVPPLR
jgi:hypothetical protein